jgi:hypothetical protein
LLGSLADATEDFVSRESAVGPVAARLNDAGAVELRLVWRFCR